MSINKTLIGKEGYLFLINDACRELKVHCDNLNLVKNEDLPHLHFDNYMLMVIPNKSLYYKNYLPDEYVCQYRPALDIYKKKLQDNLLDGYLYLKDIEDAYYKTDTHINLKGNYILYLEFVKKVNELFNLNLIPVKINLDVKKNVELTPLNIGTGDLTWEQNLGSQELLDKTDNYYYSDDIDDFYCRYLVTNESNIRFLDYSLIDKTDDLVGSIVYWDIISKYIIYKKNIDSPEKHKVLIFYDSNILSILPLYLELFYEVYMIKSAYKPELIKLINPKYVFENRIERFLF